MAQSLPRERILNVAERLFYEEGTHAVGIDRIIAETGVAKATFYRHFSSKNILIENYLRERHERIISTIERDLESVEADSAARILRLFDLLAEKAENPTFRGCAFLVAMAENEGFEPVAAIARQHKAALRGIIRRLCADFTEDHERLSEELALCYEGALATIAVSRNSQAVAVARRCALMLMEPRIVRRPVPETVPPLADLANEGPSVRAP